MSKDNSEPAFPSDSNEFGAVLGMSLRDHFAAKAIAKIAPSFGEIGELATSGHEIEEILSLAAKYAYEIADQMLAARSAQPRRES
ncbi:hypothetical protein [Pseudomonas gessardii]|uniref:Uncharacterized protein n=1 Tax=Pseudomonas gessardii TaxID=78544 RepID=A0A7Y1MW17_9PSED|nr:hypothetical protein [Pseudomonas gessardii]NNA99266.1 hypothetical protein [Pseudomonas gessardii]